MIRSVSELARRLGAVDVTALPSTEVSGFATDHRDVHSGNAFIAIKGARVDGHMFCDEAMSRGAAVCIVEKLVDAPHILVPNVATALGQFGSSIREEFSGPVIGITGSVGKTTTKEMIAAALAPLGTVLKSEGNRNTEWTSPLVWDNLGPNSSAAVIEMSMRGFGHIAHLANVHKPNIGIITMIGASHLELVGSLEGVAKAKGELIEALPADGLAILPVDDPFFDQLAATSPVPVLTFGRSKNATLRLNSFLAQSWTEGLLNVSYQGESHAGAYKLNVPFAGEHFAINACAALLVAITSGVAVEDAIQAIESMPGVPGRMDVHDFNGVTLVFDAYNASPQSFAAALRTLHQVPCRGRRIVVAGEMKELGDASQIEHRRIGELMHALGVDVAVFYGEEMESAFDILKNAGWGDRAWMANDHDAIRAYIESLQPGDTVLIKGSRAMELDKAMPEVCLR